MKILILISGFFFISSAELFGQNEKIIERQVVCDTIKESKFNRTVKKKYKYIKEDRNVDVSEMINLVKIYNTLQFERNYHYRNKYRNRFRERFKEYYVDKAVMLLECKPYQGNWYSPKYDLFITSGYRMKCDNYYFLK